MTAREDDGTERWSRMIDRPSVVDANEDLVTCADGGELLYLDPATGDLIERVSVGEAGEPIEHLAVAPDACYAVIGDTDEELVAVTHDGPVPAWRVEVPGVESPPHVTGGVVTVQTARTPAPGSRRTALRVFDSSDGESMMERAPADAPPIVGEEGIYTYDSSSCEAVALAYDGTTRWRSPLPDSHCDAETPRPHLFPDRVVYRAGETGIVGFRRRRGTRRGIFL